MRVGLMVLVPLLVLIAIESGLRLGGYGYATSFFIPDKTGEEYITNEKFAWQFFSRNTVLRPFLMKLTARKPANTIRICVLGESAAMGTPDPGYSFGRILEILLQRRYPERRFEILNAAMRGINSHVIRKIAAECTRHEVDGFIVYAGNNEVIGLHCPEPNSAAWTQSLFLIRAGQWARATRLGQLFASLLLDVNPAGELKQDMDYFRRHGLRPDDWRREKNRDNFRTNLGDICSSAASIGAKVFLCTVGSNLRDFPPLESMHRAGLSTDDMTRWQEAYDLGVQLESRRQFQEALGRYQAAAAIDDHFADLHFHLARCLMAVNRTDEAQAHYTLARDWDALQFRTDSKANAQIRNVAAAHQSEGVVLVETERAFSRNELSDQGVPGEALFHDHVHPTFAGNYLLARTCFDALVNGMGAALGQTASTHLPTREECADALAYTLYDELNIVAAMVRLTAEPPFLDQLDHAQRQSLAQIQIENRLAVAGSKEAENCIKTYLAAIRQRSNDWPLRFNLASIYEEQKQFSAAVDQFRWLVGEFPNTAAFRFRFGNLLATAGDNANALNQFNEGLRIDPQDEGLRQAWQKLAGASQ